MLGEMSVQLTTRRNGAAGRRWRLSRKWAGLLFVLPALALVTMFFVLPVGMTMWMSLHDWPLLGTPRFTGLRNYERILIDKGFWNAMGFTLHYTVIVTIAIFAVAFPLALFVEKPKPFLGFYRTVYFMPVVVGLATASLLWVWLLNVDSGLFSPALEALGLTSRKVNLLAEFDSAFAAIIVMVVWKIAGFTMVILLTGLQSISPELGEAARIDGAGPLQRLRYITLPLMRRTFALALIVSVTGSVLAFDQFYIMTAGGPQNQTMSVVYWIFTQSFVSFRLGYGSALSIVLLVLLVAISIGQLWLLKAREEN